MGRPLRWTDVNDIAIALEETHPDVDVVNLRFTDLWTWVQQLPVVLLLMGVSTGFEGGRR